jgi:hypothetical protein
MSQSTQSTQQTPPATAQVVAPQQQPQQPAAAHVGGMASTKDPVEKGAKSTEPEIVIDTSAQKQQIGGGAPTAASAWGGAPVGMGLGMGSVIFASMGGPLGGFATDATWIPPSDPDFKHPRHPSHPSHPVPAAAPGGPQRPGSRRYNEVYGGDDGWSGEDDKSGDGGGGGGDADGGESGDEGGENGEDPTVAFHKHPQRAAMCAAYGNVREQNLRDMTELYDQLLNSQDIRELDTEVLRSILLSGRRQYTTEIYEDTIHGLLVVIEATLERLSKDSDRTPGVHPGRRAANEKQNNSRPPQPIQPSQSHPQPQSQPQQPQQPQSQPQQLSPHPSAAPPMQPQVVMQQLPMQQQPQMQPQMQQPMQQPMHQPQQQQLQQQQQQPQHGNGGRGVRSGQPMHPMGGAPQAPLQQPQQQQQQQQQHYPPQQRPQRR